MGRGCDVGGGPGEDANVTDHLETALTQIDRRLEELEAKQPTRPLKQ
jgi:hypothetical protein